MQRCLRLSNSFSKTNVHPVCQNQHNLKYFKKMRDYYHKPEENKFYIRNDGTYISKGNYFYRAYRADGSEIMEAVIPINMCLMKLKGILPVSVKVIPTEEEIMIEPDLKYL
jgi:hypothetical protein